MGYSSILDPEFLSIVNVISVISNIIAIIVGILIAKGKGRSAAWGWLAFLLGWIGVIIIACQSNLNKNDTITYSNNVSTSGYSLNPYVNAKKSEPEIRWTCPYCNASNNGKATRCINCGKDKIEGWKCSSCHTINDKSKSFCSNCGKEQPTSWICNNCNIKNEPADKFCSNCGNKKPE